MNTWFKLADGSYRKVSGRYHAEVYEDEGAFIWSVHKTNEYEVNNGWSGNLHSAKYRATMEINKCSK